MGVSPEAPWIAAISVFTGASAAKSYGAAGSVPWVVLPPRTNSVTCPATGGLDAAQADAAYAFGHEVGHGFGLAHSCDVYGGAANCGESIMQFGKPPEAIRLQGEIDQLRKSSYFP